MTEFAIIATGGKQYPVSVGDVIRVETLAGEYKKGDKVVFNEVLLVDNGKDTTIGAPFIERRENSMSCGWRRSSARSTAK